MKLEELYTELSIDPFKLIESIVHAEGSSVILFKNRKSEILYVNEQFYHKHPQFKDCKECVLGKTDFDLFPDSQEHAKQAFNDEQKVMETGKAINVVETEGKTEKGHTIIAHTRKYPVHNKAGEVIGVFVITEEMTSDGVALRENQEKAKILTKLNVELSQENATDALSQLYNRRFIHAELDTLHKEYIKNNTPFSILLLDLDNFKSVNDNYGHHIGDEVIKHVGNILLNIKHQKYPTIEPCRYGGDEFLVILPAYQKDGAVSIARDIKDAFDHVVLHAGNYNDIVRLSIGVAGIRDEESVQDLMNKCDQRMYISKRDGKGRITY